jgi:hypothetical protein
MFEKARESNGNNYRDDYRIYALRFGYFAVMKEFVTKSQMEEAISEQISTYPSTRFSPHKLIGEILLEKGWITFEQILIVLKELSEKKITADIA